MFSSRSGLFSRSDIFLLVLLLATMGCGGRGGGDVPELGQVTGIVTMDGQPLSDATVSFQSAEAGRVASGTTDSTGRYTLYLLNDLEGAPVGTNEVVITTAKPADDADPGSGQPETVPEKYNSETTLTAEVEPGQNELNFDLTSS